MESDAVPLGLALVRRRRGVGPGAAIGRVQLRLSSVQRRALHSDTADHDRDLLAEAHADRRPGGAFDNEVSACPNWHTKKAMQRNATSPPSRISGRTTAIFVRKTPFSSSSICRPTFAGSADMSTRWVTTCR